MSNRLDGDGFYDRENGARDAAPALPEFLLDPFGVLNRRWRWMLAALLAGLVATGVAAFLVKPEFTAEARVLVTSQRISEAFVTSTVVSNEVEKINAILSEIRSRRSIVEMINEFSLFESDEPDKALPMQERVISVLSSITIEPEALTGGNDQRRQQGAIVYGISYCSGNAVEAAVMANAIATRFTDTHLEMRHRQARLTTRFLGTELEEVERDLTTQERAIRDFKEAHRGELPGELQTNLGRLERLQQQRESLSLQIAEAETRLANIAQNEQLDENSPHGRLERLQGQYDTLLGLYTAEHPNVVTMKRRIETLEAVVAKRDADTGQRAGTSGAAATMLTELNRQRDATVAEFDELDARVANTPARQEELDSLEQRAEILRENHQEFLRKVSQAELSEAVESAQQGERATVLDAAQPPNAPDRSPLLLVFAGIVGSFGLAIGIALLLELVDGVIVSPGELERETGVPVFASIPRVG